MKILLDKDDFFILRNNIPHAGSDNQKNIAHHRIHMYIHVEDWDLT